MTYLIRSWRGTWPIIAQGRSQHLSAWFPCHAQNHPSLYCYLRLCVRLLISPCQNCMLDQPRSLWASSHSGLAHPGHRIQLPSTAQCIPRRIALVTEAFATSKDTIAFALLVLVLFLFLCLLGGELLLLHSQRSSTHDT